MNEIVRPEAARLLAAVGLDARTVGDVCTVSRTHAAQLLTCEQEVTVIDSDTGLRRTCTGREAARYLDTSETVNILYM